MFHHRYSKYVIIFIIIMMVGCGSSETRKTKFFDKGTEFFEKGDYGKAILNFQNAIKLDPQYADAYSSLGRCYLKLMNIQGAFKAFSTAVEINPEILDAQVALGQIYLMSKEKEKAIEKAELVLSKNPDHEDALMLKAKYLILDDKDAEAETILHSLLKKNVKKEESYLTLANIRLKNNDTKGAEQILRTLLGEDSKNQSGRLLLIQILEREKRFSDAEKEYLTLVEQKPESDLPKVLLARFYSRTQRLDEAETILKDLVQLRPDKNEYPLLLAQFYANQGKDNAMIEVLQKAITDFPAHLAPYIMLARYELGKNRESDAISLMNQFIEKSEVGPDLFKAKVFLAGIYYQDQNFDQTMTLVEEVLAKNPKDLAAHTIKGSVFLSRKNFLGAISEYRTVLQEKPEDIAVSLNLAKAHLLNDEPGIATDLFRSVLDINPDIKEALLFLGDMALQKKNFRSADEHYSHLLKLEPEAALPNYKVGLVKLLDNKEKEALPYFEKALAVNGNYVSALAQIAYASIRGGDHDAAVTRVQKHIDGNPQNPDFYVLLGRIYAIGKNFPKARQSFEEAFKIDPDNENALFNLAQLEQSQGSINEALEYYEKIRAKNPDNSFISLMIAMLLETKGETEKAREIYEQVLVTNPENVIAVNNLAFYLAEHEPTPENLARAEALILPLRAKAKGNLSLTDTIAWIYYRKGEYEKARDLLITSQEDDITIPAVNYHLGMIFSRLDEKELAKKYLQVALETQSAFPGREDAELELKKLSQ